MNVGSAAGSRTCRARRAPRYENSAEPERHAQQRRAEMAEQHAARSERRKRAPNPGRRGKPVAGQHTDPREQLPEREPAVEQLGRNRAHVSVRGNDPALLQHLARCHDGGRLRLAEARRCEARALEHAIRVPVRVPEDEPCLALQLGAGHQRIEPSPRIHVAALERQLAIGVLQGDELDVCLRQAHRVERQEQEHERVGPARGRDLFSFQVGDALDARARTRDERGPLRSGVDVDRSDRIVVGAGDQRGSARRGGKVDALAAEQLERFVGADALDPFDANALRRERSFDVALLAFQAAPRGSARPA